MPVTGLLGLAAFSILPACSTRQPLPEKGCGVEMTGREIEEVQRRDTAYHYEGGDLYLHEDVSAGVWGLFNDTLEIEVFFFLHDKNSMGIMIGLPDKAVGTEKISCYLFNNDFNGRLPKNRYILFFQSENSDWLFGIKNRQAP